MITTTSSVYDAARREKVRPLVESRGRPNARLSDDGLFLEFEAALRCAVPSTKQEEPLAVCRSLGELLVRGLRDPPIEVLRALLKQLPPPPVELVEGIDVIITELLAPH
jgi:hypothetical protein